MKPLFKKYLLIALGSLSLGLGAVGVALPVLPTTPFLLVTLYCYLRSSRRLYDWLIHHRLFGKYLYNYVAYRAVPRQTKLAALVVLWAGLITSMILVNILWVRLLLLAVGVAVSIHLFLLKTIDASQLREPSPMRADTTANKE
ncbi:MAG: DUF454 domain-containing protein [Clostridiales bacterium]|nr:DUF454 domain-containing protein [Clostridiales bacterium]